jgi:hypothetical protein
VRNIVLSQQHKNSTAAKDSAKQYLKDNIYIKHPGSEKSPLYYNTMATDIDSQANGLLEARLFSIMVSGVPERTGMSAMELIQLPTYVLAMLFRIAKFMTKEEMLKLKPKDKLGRKQ